MNCYCLRNTWPGIPALCACADGVKSVISLDTGNQISGSRHLNFVAPAPTSRSFWLRLDNDLDHWKLLYYLYNWLAPQTMAVEPEPKFPVPAPAPQCKSLWPAVIQNCLGSGSTALVATNFMHSVCPKNIKCETLL